MGVWTDRMLPRLTDKSLSRPEIRPLREAACRELAGRVLEIGFGSGLNIGLYPAAVTHVDAVEPSELAWSISADRRATAGIPIERVGADVQDLVVRGEVYDGVLSTWTLCTIPDVGKALREVRRVLRPGGTFHFLEHGRAPDDGVVRWQRRLDPVQRRVCGGCHLSRDIPSLIEAAGLSIVEVDARYLPGPSISRPWTYAFVGRAARLTAAESA